MAALWEPRKRTRMSPKGTVSKPALKALATAYTPEAWEQLEQQRKLMLENHITVLFQERVSLDDLVIQVNKKLLVAIGDPSKVSQKILHLAVKNAGEEGLALADARRYVPDPTDLNEAREFLLVPKDENGEDMTPMIKEKRGKNNEIRLFLVEQEDEEEAAAAE